MVIVVVLTGSESSAIDGQRAAGCRLCTSSSARLWDAVADEWRIAEQLASTAPSDCASSGVWGFARVLRLEHVDLRMQTGDISHGIGAPSARAMLMAGATTEPETAWEGSTRYVARLRSCSMASMASQAKCGLVCGSYAISGGLGGLGRRAATLLLEHGAAPCAGIAQRSCVGELDGVTAARSRGGVRPRRLC